MTKVIEDQQFANCNDALEPVLLGNPKLSAIPVGRAAVESQADADFGAGVVARSRAAVTKLAVVNDTHAAAGALY